MSLNSLESEGLRPPHFLSLHTWTCQPRLGQATGCWRQLTVVRGGQGCLYLLFHGKQLQSMRMYSEEWNGVGCGGQL